MANGLIFGLDVSHYQPGYDFHAAYGKGARFAGVQLTVGTWRDPEGHDNCLRALDAGLYVMPYHFLTGQAGKAQANAFIDALNDLPIAELHPVIDIEPKGGCDREAVYVTYEHYIRQADTPITYTGPGAFSAVMESRTDDLAGRFRLTKLWNADYRNGRPTDADDRRFDLYYGNGVYGYGGFKGAQIVQFGPRFGTDGDAFAGDEHDLDIFFGKAVPVDPTLKLFPGARSYGHVYSAVKRKQVRSLPQVLVANPKAGIVDHLAPGELFPAAQRLVKSNGHIWFGNKPGTLWILKNERIVRVS